MKGLKVVFMDVDGTLTSGKLLPDDNVLDKFFNVKDGLAVSLLRRFGLKVVWVSGKVSEAVRRRADHLAVDELYEGVRKKWEFVSKYLKDNGLSLEEIAFVGDDLNDLAVFKRLRYTFCPADAHPHIRKVARFVLKRRGGDGAIMELTKIILWERQEWVEALSLWS